MDNRIAQEAIGTVLSKLPPTSANRIRALSLRKVRAHLPIEALAVRSDRVIQLGAPSGRTLKRLTRATRPDGQVLVIEASPENFAQLEKAVQAMDPQDQARIQLVEAAVYSSRATLELAVSDVYPGDHRLMLDGIEVDNDEREGASYSDTCKVEAYTIDQIAKEQDFHPTAIIATINGAELDAMKGAEETLGAMPHGSRVFVKAHALQDGQPIAKSVMSILESHGFTAIKAKASRSVSSSPQWGHRQGDVFAFKSESR